MKNAFKLPILIVCLILVSCTTDSPEQTSTSFNNVTNTTSGDGSDGDNTGGGGTDGDNTGGGGTGGGSTGGTGTGSTTNLWFAFLDIHYNDRSYINMPIESSSSNLIVGRWKITKIGIDELNNGNVIYYNYLDYRHYECGISFVQFNNNGIVFENSYYNNNSTCVLWTTDLQNWEQIANNRFKIGNYNNIYLINVNQSELVLKYDWNFDGSLYGPTQTYFYFERILAAN